MSEIVKGDKILIHIEGTTTGGFSFSTKTEGGPVEVVVGEGAMIPAVESGVIGMKAGETKKVVVDAKDAPPRDETLVITLPREHLPDGGEMAEVGQVIVLGDEEGGQAQAMIIDVDEETFTIDANPPVAGQGLTLVIEIVEKY
jgi:peptidylprolyl isomerase